MGRRELIERAFDGWSGDAAGKAAEGAKAVGHKCGSGGRLKVRFPNPTADVTLAGQLGQLSATT